MLSPISLLTSLSLTLFLRPTAASVTVYGISGIEAQEPLTLSASSSASSSDPTNLPAFNSLVLQPPPVPVPAPPTRFVLTVPATTQDAVVDDGLMVSVVQNGSFFGFSIEFSVVDQVSECCGWLSFFLSFFSLDAGESSGGDFYSKILLFFSCSIRTIPSFLQQK